MLGPDKKPCKNPSLHGSKQSLLHMPRKRNGAEKSTEEKSETYSENNQWPRPRRQMLSVSCRAVLSVSSFIASHWMSLS